LWKVSFHEKESAMHLLEKLNEQRKSIWEEPHTLQPQSLEPTEEIRHRCLIPLVGFSTVAAINIASVWTIIMLVQRKHQYVDLRVH
jgi:hypothetical protein